MSGHHHTQTTDPGGNPGLVCHATGGTFIPATELTTPDEDETSILVEGRTWARVICPACDWGVMVRIDVT